MLAIVEYGAESNNIENNHIMSLAEYPARVTGVARHGRRNH